MNTNALHIDARLTELYREHAALTQGQFAGVTSRIAPSERVAEVNAEIARLWRAKGI